MLTLVLALALHGGAAATLPPAGDGECFVLAPLDGGPERMAGGSECDRRTLPASTFKIPHALAALDAGVITGTTVLKWDGEKKDYPIWERDHTLDSAIKMSVVWFFQRVATMLGRERELEYLRAFHYGSASFTGPVDQFWLNGALQISPREQIAFLKKMFAFELPVARRHVDTVMRAMTMPAGKVLSAAGDRDFVVAWPNPTLRVKTGNGTADGQRASWLVGEIESGGKRYVFASRRRSAASAPAGATGADLALRMLNAAAP